MTKPTRTETALRLRDHALSIIRRHGSPEPVGKGLNMLTWRGGSFVIMHRTPFQKWDTGPDVAVKSLAAKHGLSMDQAKYAATLHSLKLPEVLPYCIDVNHGRKVFSMEWADDGRAYIVNFKRGPWEAEFLMQSFNNE